MTNQKDRNFYQLSNREKELSKPDHSWLAQYDEEDDFLSNKVSSSLVQSTENE